MWRNPDIMFGMIAMMKEKLSSSRIFCSHTTMMKMNYLFLHTQTHTHVFLAMIYVDVCMKVEQKEEEEEGN